MTPREYYRESAAAAERWRDEGKRDFTLAWTVAALTAQAQVGKLTDLRTMLAQRDGPRRSSREEQRQMFHYLSDRYRIPLKVVH